MPKFAAALNEQIGYEFGASQQYVAIAVHYDAQTLPQEPQFCLSLCRFTQRPAQAVDGDDVPGVVVRIRTHAGARFARAARQAGGPAPGQRRAAVGNILTACCI